MIFWIYSLRIICFLKSFPLEWQGSLHNDQKMKSLYEHPKVSNQLKACKVKKKDYIFNNFKESRICF